MAALRLVHSADDADPFEDPEVLVEALQNADDRARTWLFERQAPYLRRVIARAMGVDDELPEVLQEVFLQAFRSIHTLSEPARLNAWLVRVAVFTARGVIRRRKRRRWLRFMAPEELPPLEAAPKSSSEAVRTLERVQRVLRALPVDEQIAFGLRFIEGLELTQVADACDCSLATIKRRLRRAEDKFIKGAQADEFLAAWVARSPRWGQS